MKNPKWHRDEIILALELYFRPDRGIIQASNPNVIALSKELNLLPIFSHRPDEETFRNANGVGLKLSNFLTIDPEYTGKGMAAHSKLDKKVFEEFVNDRESLRAIAARIRSVIRDEPLRQSLLQVEEDTDVSTDLALHEGEVLYRLHKYRERNAKLIIAKKKSVLKATGALACEVCSFDFAKVYGKLGEGYIECHHTKPLAGYDISSVTKLEDLAVVCANCHRMLHRGIGVMGIGKLMSKRNN